LTALPEGNAVSPDALSNVLILTSALCWTAAYLLILHRSRKDRAYGMPAAACVANLAWEFYYVFIKPFRAPQVYVNALWLGIDLLILIQILAYIPSSFPKISRQFIRGLVLGALPLGFGVIHFSHQAHLIPVSSAYAQNFMMSALFIGMLLHRGTADGQSLYVAVLKGLGTVLISVLLYAVNRVHRELSIMTFLYVGTLALDVVYFFLLYVTIRKQGLSPWRHW
jgi:hypothetical protein